MEEENKPKDIEHQTDNGEINVDNVSKDNIQPNISSLAAVNSVKGKPNRPQLKSKISLIMIGVSLILIGLGIVLFVLGNNKNNSGKKEEQQKGEHQIELTNGEKELTDKKSKEEIDKFYKVIEGSTDYIKYHFVAGDLITNSNEIYIAIHSLFDNNKFTKLKSDNLPDKYKKYKQNADKGCMIQMSFDDIKNEFENYFDDTAEFDTLDLTSVNELLCIENESSFDEELKILIFDKCACSEGESNNTLYMSKYKYTYDDDNYYLYLHAAMGNKSEFYTLSTNTKVDVDSFKGNESKFELFKWTFNKNYDFVKSEITAKSNVNNQ